MASRKRAFAPAVKSRSPVAVAPRQEAREAGLGEERALDAETRELFEPRFRVDLGNVRIHANEAAEEAAQALHARAFTTGSRIAFGRGQYQPQTPSGRRLIAHELAHVVQQSPAGRRRLGGAHVAGGAPPLQRQKAEEAFSGGTVQKPPDVSGRGTLALHGRAKDLAAQFEKPDLKPMERFLVARELVLITDELSRRGGEQILAQKPDPENEIWKIVGGVGDPVAGMLEAFVEPYKNISQYRQSVAELDPQGWSSDVLNRAYTANPTGQARATNFNTPVEEARSNIGKMVPTVDKAGRKKMKEFSPEIKSASAWAKEKGQSQVVVNPGYQLTGADLRFIIGDKNIDNAGLTDAQVDAALVRYADFLNEAFRLAKIDTVQAQASYLAHSAGETSLARFTEGQVEKWQDDPSKVSYSSAASGPMDYFKDSDNAELRKSAGSVDPASVLEAKSKMKQKSQPEMAATFGQTFIGRGPVQVTHDSNYTQTLIYLEELAKSAATEADREKIWEAVQAIKKEPAAAADPKYAFLFSAAYMQKTGGVRAAGALGGQVSAINFTSGATMTQDQRALFDWVSGGINVAERGSKTDPLGKSVKHASTRKQETYGRAYKRIMDGIAAMPKT